MSTNPEKVDASEGPEAEEQDASGDKDDSSSSPITLAAVGGRIHAHRRASSWSIDELSRRSGVSTGLLSQVEKGRGNPSFNILVQISHALGLSISELTEKASVSSPVVRASERRQVSEAHFAQKELGSTNELLSQRQDSLLEAIMVTAPPGYDTSSTPFTHRGEEFGIILEGRHEVFLDGTRYELNAGDSISYQSSVPHWYRNVGPDVVRAIWVITPPTF